MTHHTDESSGAEPPGSQGLFECAAAPRVRTALRLRTLCLPRCLSIAGVSALLVVVVAVGTFFLALARGPIASDWLVPKIVESLEELYTHRYEFELGSAAIANTAHGLTLSVDGLIVKMGGRTIIAAPRAELSVDLRSLLFGRLMPRRLEVLDLELRLAVMPDGVVAISAGTDPVAIPLDAPSGQAPPQTPDAAGSAGEAALPRGALLRQASGALRALFDLATSPDSPIGAIDRVGVSHAHLVIDDRTLDRTITYRDLALSFDKSTGAMSFSLAATGASGRWSAEATAKGAPGSRRTLDARLRRLSLDEFALVGGLRSLPFDTDAPLSVDLHFALAGDDRVVEASGRFAAGRGFFRLEEPDHEPIMIGDLSGSARWNASDRRFVIEPIEIEAGGARLTFAGSVSPPGSGAGANSDFWAVSIDLARPGSFASDRPNETPLVVDRMGLSAKIAVADKKATVDRIVIDGPDVHAAASGVIDWVDGAHVKYALNVSQTPIRSVLRLWPTHVAPPTRAWIDAHVPGGIVRSATLTADFDQATLIATRYERPPPDGALRGDFDLADGELVDALPGLAPLTGIAGRVQITGRTAAFFVSAGAMESAPGRRLTIEEGSFRVPVLGFDPAQAALELRLSGNVEAVADILALKSVSTVASLPVDGGALKGQIEGRLRVDFEMGLAAREDHTRIAIDADATNLSMERFIGKERLENAALKIISDGNGLHVSGAGRIFGAPTTLDVRRPFGDKGQAQAQLSLSLDDAARAKAGLGFTGVAGVVGAQVATKLPIDEADAQVELDFAKAALDNPLPGVIKPAGKPGKAFFNLVKRPDGSALEQLSADIGGAQVAGVVELARDGAFRSAKLSQVRLSPGDDMRVEAMRGADAFKLVVRGANIDARPMLRYLTQPPAEHAAAAGAKPPAPSSDDFDLELKSPVVTGFGKQILANVDLKVERRAGRPRLLSLTGNFGREPFVAMLTRHPSGAPQIDLSTSDGGSLLSFLDLYHRMESGALTASILLGQGRSDGTLQIHDFYLQNEPAMRQLVMQGASRLDDKGVVRFDPDSVKFSRVLAGFTWSNGRLSVRDAVMSGPETGLTVDGYIDMARDRIDVSGSFVPAYGLNSLLSNIPVLGLVLAGGQHEGVFAVSFRVTGPFSAPVLTVNPLSVIAPGLLRKVFGILDGTGRLPEGAQQQTR